MEYRLPPQYWPRRAKNRSICLEPLTGLGQISKPEPSINLPKVPGRLRFERIRRNLRGARLVRVLKNTGTAPVFFQDARNQASLPDFDCLFIAVEMTNPVSLRLCTVRIWHQPFQIL